MLFHLPSPLEPVPMLLRSLVRDDAPSRSASPFAVYSSPDALLLRAALPGVDPKDLVLELEDDVLSVSARVAEEPASSGALAAHRERRGGSFSRCVRLPFEVDAARVEARLERGVLEVRIPRLPKAPPVKIQVRVDTPSA